MSGMEMLQKVTRAFDHGIRYRLILTDFNMVEMDGIEATYKLRSFFETKKIRREDQPIIIGITGNVAEQFSIMGKAAGMNLIISKPIYFKDLEALLEKYGLVCWQPLL